MKERKKKMEGEDKRWRLKMKIEVVVRVFVKERKKKMEGEGKRWQ